jgi:SAM-dependent methyltransferase
VSQQESDRQARGLAAQARAAGDPTGWFEQLYAAAADGKAQVPWDRAAPHPLLVEWARTRQLNGAGRRALVVGCGLGYDAEFVAGRGYATTAFDISGSAVRAARAAFPGSPVQYLVADLLHPLARWQGGFDLVLESMTVQALPDPLRRDAIASVRRLVGPGGTLLVIAIAAAQPPRPEDGPPWPLVRAEIDAFAAGGLRPVQIDEVREDGVPRRWRAEFSRPDPCPAAPARE